MRVQTLGSLGSMPRGFAPAMFHDHSTNVSVPGLAVYKPPAPRRGIAGLGEAGLAESVGLLALGAVVGGALGFVIGAASIAWAGGGRRGRW